MIKFNMEKKLEDEIIKKNSIWKIISNKINNKKTMAKFEKNKNNMI
jgi:hypothetical protein